jgi:hypothetical protein
LVLWQALRANAATRVNGTVNLRMSLLPFRCDLALTLMA